MVFLLIGDELHACVGIGLCSIRSGKIWGAFDTELGEQLERFWWQKSVRTVGEGTWTVREQ